MTRQNEAGALAPSVAEVADAILTIRAFLTGLGRTVVEHSETPLISKEYHFDMSVSGLRGDEQPFGGHELIVWLHGRGWAEHVTHTDPTCLVQKAQALAHIADEIRSRTAA